MRYLAVMVLAVAGVSGAALACKNMVLETLAAQCGKAFEGRVILDTEASDAWADQRIVMHIRDCDEKQIKIPLHVGDNRSRVWILTDVGDGLTRLKHDHRHADGHPDDVTLYGGTSVTPGAQVLSFPVDAESIAMFEANGLTASVNNTWHMRAGDGTFQYQLTRPSGRDFIIEFNMTNPVPVPPPAWDKAGHQGGR